MIEKYCLNCGNIFFHQPGEEWKTVCIPCFKEKKREEEREIFFRDPPQPPKERVVYVDRVVYKEVQKEIPSDIMDRIIRLCHPDRHGNSEMSNKATAWLLAQRKK